MKNQDIRLIAHRIYPWCSGRLEHSEGHLRVCNNNFRILELSLEQRTEKYRCMWCGKFMPIKVDASKQAIRDALEDHMKVCDHHPYFRVMKISEEIVEHDKEVIDLMKKVQARNAELRDENEELWSKIEDLQNELRVDMDLNNKIKGQLQHVIDQI